MMKKIILAAVPALMFAALFSGCSNTLEAETVDMKNPEQFVITLEENPTTGYTWSYSVSPEGLIELVSDNSIVPESSGELAGAPGKHEWVFKAVEDGDVTITFEYARSFEEDISPDTVMVYNYTIAEKVPVLVDITEGVGKVPEQAVNEE